MNAVLRRRSRAGTLAGAVLCILFLVVSPLARPEAASAHAQFDTSDPAPNSVLQTPPPRITLHFTEPLENAYSRVELYDETGARVQGVVSQFDAQNRQTMTLPLPGALANGTYSAVWRTLSAADGHRAKGYVAFTIGTAANIRTVIPPAAADSVGPSLLLRTLSRWIPLLGLALSLAVWPVWLMVLRPAISPAWQVGPALTRRVRRLAALGMLTTALGSVFALGVQALGTVEGAGLVRSLATTMTDTRYGRLWLLRMVLLLVYALLLLLAAWWRPRRHPAMTSLTLLAAFALPLPFSLISHAAAQTTGRGTAVASDMAHLIGASLWVGGLFLFVGALLPTLRALTPRVAASSSPRRSRASRRSRSAPGRCLRSPGSTAPGSTSAIWRGCATPPTAIR